MVLRFSSSTRSKVVLGVLGNYTFTDTSTSNVSTDGVEKPKLKSQEQRSINTIYRLTLKMMISALEPRITGKMIAPMVFTKATTCIPKPTVS